MNFRQLIYGQEELVEKIINFFTASANNPELFAHIRESVKNDKFTKCVVKGHEAVVSMGFLTLWDFLHFENEYAQKKGIQPWLVEMVLDRMCESGILKADPLIQQSHYRAYMANEYFTQFLSARDCLTNLIFGFPFIAEKYQRSIFKIAVFDDVGDQHIGTGFLIQIQKAKKNVSVIITNEHVAKFSNNLRVLTQTNENVGHLKIIKSQVSDLAAIELSEVHDLPAFYIAEDPCVLDEVITMGYPNVAMARDSYQLTHAGEINSIIQTGQGNTLVLFSAKTAPGNSGGPLLNYMGLVTGIVCEDLFYKDALIEKGQLPYHAAIPASEINKFLTEEYSAS
jgi:S1-C subfamily serine protease